MNPTASIRFRRITALAAVAWALVGLLFSFGQFFRMEPTLMFPFEMTGVDAVAHAEALASASFFTRPSMGSEVDSVTAQPSGSAKATKPKKVAGRQGSALRLGPPKKSAQSLKGSGANDRSWNEAYNEDMWQNDES